MQNKTGENSVIGYKADGDKSATIGMKKEKTKERMKLPD
jgi:hypothetical protein